MNPDLDRIYRRYVDLQVWVGWIDEDAGRIHGIRPLLLPHLASLVESFSADVAQHPFAQQILNGGAGLGERLEPMLLNWLTDLLTGPYDRDYVARRWRFGTQVVEIGIDQVYTNAVMSRIRDGLVQHLGASWTGDCDGLVAAIRSLNKLVDLDLAKIEDAYQSEYIARLQGNERLAMLGQIAGGIAHEIRNPLNVIKTSHYFLRAARNPSPEKRDEHMQRIERNVRQAEHIIATLTSFARMPAADRKPFSVKAGIREAVEDSAVPAGIEVVVDCPDDLPLALADSAQLRIALGNLVRNACEAMPDGGRLTVRGRALDGAAEIAVIDTGVGIAAAQLERITEPLYSTKARGLGLGLALARMILERNSATMSVASEPGHGSTLAIRLALAPQENDTMSGTSPSVLVVDHDVVDTCANMADILADFGYEVDVAHEGATALEKIRRRPYDVALLDLRMPGMDGVTLCREIRRIRSGVVPMLVTAYAGPETAQQAVKAGASQVLFQTGRPRVANGPGRGRGRAAARAGLRRSGPLRQPGGPAARARLPGLRRPRRGRGHCETERIDPRGSARPPAPRRRRRPGLRLHPRGQPRSPGRPDHEIPGRAGFRREPPDVPGRRRRALQAVRHPPAPPGP